MIFHTLSYMVSFSPKLFYIYDDDETSLFTVSLSLVTSLMAVCLIFHSPAKLYPLWTREIQSPLLYGRTLFPEVVSTPENYQYLSSSPTTNSLGPNSMEHLNGSMLNNSSFESFPPNDLPQ